MDYRLFEMWSQAKVWFVTRMKKNAPYRVVEERRPPQNSHVICDQLIKLTGQTATEGCPRLLRRVVVWDAENERPVVLLTNHLDFGATTISKIYKDRWEIELFFKALKQNLKVKTFVGTSANALRIQIPAALIAMLLIKYLQFKSRMGWSLSNLVALRRRNLFTCRDLWEWVDDPFHTPPEAGGFRQKPLPFLDSTRR